MAQVITYQSPRGNTIDLCRACIDHYRALGDWPRDRVDGQEYCTVSHGLHNGTCWRCAIIAEVRDSAVVLFSDCDDDEPRGTEAGEYDNEEMARSAAINEALDLGPSHRVYIAYDDTQEDGRYYVYRLDH